MEPEVILAGRFKLTEFIGEGGMSKVYRAVDLQTREIVAVKILKPEFSQDAQYINRFCHEAEAAGKMDHINIVRLLNVGMDGDTRYLVYEYVDGQTLKDIILQQGRIAQDPAVDVVVRILAALEHAHDHSVIHRDIKPQNVLIDQKGYIKVTDFGIARTVGHGTISQENMVLGTVYYSSPEQVSGKPVDARSDLYSVGIVLYEMLTGHLPFVGDTTTAIAMQHLAVEPPSVQQYAPETSKVMAAFIRKALRKNPADRFQSAREMAAALLMAQKGMLDPSWLPEPTPGTLAPEAPEPVKTENPQTPTEKETHKTPEKVPEGKTRKRKRHRLIRVLRVRFARHKVLWTVFGTLLIVAALAAGMLLMYQQISQSAVAPDVVGMAYTDAETQIRKEGLNCQQTLINHDSIPAGEVIQQVPEADTAMQKGDTLVLTVSSGPSTTTTPAVVGSTYDEATARLKAAGFENVVVVKTVSTEPVNQVLQQTPEAGMGFLQGQSAEITISGGSAMVPDVVGRTLEEAQTALQSSSLTTAEAVYMETTDPSQVGKVLQQSPAAGTMTVLSAPVTLTIGSERHLYRSEIHFQMPGTDADRTLLITLIAGGAETTVYEGTLPAGETADMLIPVVSTVEGAGLCRIYIDNTLTAEMNITLK